ncbi:MAG TPA: hypothetical protein VGR21_02905 [Cryptosporangiaceae bacterium]|nr:hypothetical protein [Cryptosporangiaceae bacterium]
MKGGRWVQVAVAAAIFVVINLVARAAVRLAGPPDDARDLTVAVWSLGTMGVAAGVIGFLWTRRERLGRVAADLTVAVVTSALVVTLVGPFVSGTTPFASGFTFFLLLLAACVGVLSFGSALGVMIATALGLDPKSRAWQAYARSVKLPKGAQRPGKSRTKPKTRTARR